MQKSQKLMYFVLLAGLSLALYACPSDPKPGKVRSAPAYPANEGSAENKPCPEGTAPDSSGKCGGTVPPAQTCADGSVLSAGQCLPSVACDAPNFRDAAGKCQAPTLDCNLAENKTKHECAVPVRGDCPAFQARYQKDGACTRRTWTAMQATTLVPDTSFLTTAALPSGQLVLGWSLPQAGPVFNTYDPETAKWDEVKKTDHNEKPSDQSGLQIQGDSEGNIFALCKWTTSGGQKVGALRYAAVDKKWGEPVFIDPNLKPLSLGDSLAVTPQGDAFVSWIRGGRAWYRLYSKSAKAWQASIELTPELTSTLLHANVNDGLDILMVSHHMNKDYSNPQISSRFFTKATGQWATIAAYPLANVGTLVLNGLGDGVAYTTKDGLEMAAFDFDTKTWKAKVSYPDTAHQTAPAVVVNQTGDILVAFTTGDSISLAKYKKASASWDAPMELTDTATDIFDLDMAIDSSGNSVLTWIEKNGDKDYVLKARTYTHASGSWDASETLARSMKTLNAVDAALTHKGDAIVKYAEEDGQTRVIKISQLK